MTARLTAADVRLVINRPELGQVMAMVRGRNGREFVTDLNPLWSREWLCTCGYAPDCAHVRATKEALRG